MDQGPIPQPKSHQRFLKLIRRNPLKFTTTAIALVVILAAGIYTVYMLGHSETADIHSSSPTQPQPTPSTTPKPQIATSSAEPTATPTPTTIVTNVDGPWQTYTNTDNGYSISYPSSFYIFPTSTIGVGSRVTNFNGNFPPGTDESKLILFNFAIIPQNNSDQLSLTDWIHKNHPEENNLSPLPLNIGIGLTKTDSTSSGATTVDYIYHFGKIFIIQYSAHSSLQQTANKMASSLQINEEPNYFQGYNTAGGVFYVSDNLGIAFTYAQHYYGTDWSAKEEGDRIYLISSKEPDRRDIFVEVLNKNSNENLTQAIDRLILKGYNLNDCPLVAPNPGIQPFKDNLIMYYNATYLPAGDPTKCPATYVSNGVKKIFVESFQRPSKFFFLNLGSDGPPVNGNIPFGWIISLQSFQQ